MIIHISLNSLTNANENELTFFNDISQLKNLEKTKAKACLINNELFEIFTFFNKINFS